MTSKSSVTEQQKHAILCDGIHPLLVTSSQPKNQQLQILFHKVVM